jgi:hypothetical protein
LSNNNGVKNFDFTQDLSSFNFLALQKIRGDEMAKCEVCGNDYDKSFEVLMNSSGKTITAICHAPWMLASAEITKGK